MPFISPFPASAKRPASGMLAGLLSRWQFSALLGVLASIFFLFIGIPLVSLLIRETPLAIWNELMQPDTLQALELSLITTTLSTVFSVLFGLPVAYLLARGRFRGRGLLETLVTMPTVLPPVVAGLALLLTFGRLGLLGKYLALFGVSIPFTTAAVVMAQAFVAAPFFINSAKAGFEQLDTRYEMAAYTLRASPFYAFRHVVLPLVRPALLAGIGLAWARALGEFGATITFAGNFPGTTQTMTTAVYIASQDNMDKAIALAVVLLAVSFGMLLALRLRRT